MATRRRKRSDVGVGGRPQMDPRDLASTNKHDHVKVTIRIPRDLLIRLHEVMESTDLSRDWSIQKAVEAYVDKHEKRGM